MNKNEKTKPKRSLRWVLALWFLLFAIVPLIFLTYYSLDKFQQTVDHELALRLKGNLSEVKVIVSDYQRAMEQQQKALIDSPALKQALSRRDKTALDDLLSEWIPQAASSTLTVYYASGDLMAEKSKLPDLHGELSPSGGRKKIALHPKIVSNVAALKELLLVDFTSPQKLQLTLISSLEGGHQTLGYLKQTLVLEHSFLKRLSERMQIQTILLESDGRVSVGSHPDFLLYKADFFSNFLKGINTETLTLALRGEPYGFIFAQVPWGRDHFNMALGASKLASNTAIENLRVAYYTILAIMFGVLVLSVIAASNVVLRPLSELIEAIKDLHLGENIIELPIKSDNEIGQLTTSFNDLSRRILAAQRALRDKIKELEETNNHLKETQSQLVHSAKMASLGQLVAGVAHELNNPIGFISANMAHLREYSDQLLQMIDAAENDPQKLVNLKKDYDLEYIRTDLPKLISSCEDGARRTKDIVIGLRNFSRVEEKTHRPIDIHESLETTLNLLKSEFKNRIEIKRDYGDLLPVTCNQTQINQVLMNILSNAAQAISGKGTVWITTRLIDHTGGGNPRVSISIQDTGPGVPQELIGKIFDPFFTTKGVGQGTGLGLAISYGIINAHGGEIKVTSKVGAGTEFVIILPVKPKTSTSEDL